MSNGDEISSRITILRFPLIVGVVLIHNYTSLDASTIGVAYGDAWVEFVRLTISRGVAEVAVPLFFMISGYLFFFGVWSRDKYVDKLKRRLHTLLIPYLFWNLFTLVFFAVAQSFHSTQAFAYSRRFPPIHSFSFLDYINSMFGITVNYPISTQFWFIRDLMALVILAPGIHYLLARKSESPFIFIMSCLWFFGIWPLLWPSIDASFFFCLGAFLSRPERNVMCLDKFGPWISSMFFGLLVLHSSFPKGPIYINSSLIVFGVPSAWWLTGLASRTTKLRSFLMGLSGASFFVFAAHQPLVTILVRISYKLFQPTSGGAILAQYFLIPICLIAFLVALRHCLLKIMPSFLRFITGSRTF
jgi:hypothetical protein